MAICSKERMRERYMRAGDRHVDSEIVNRSEYEHRGRDNEPDISGPNKLQSAISFVLGDRAEQPILKWSYNRYDQEHDCGQPLHHEEPMIARRHSRDEKDNA